MLKKISFSFNPFLSGPGSQHSRQCFADCVLVHLLKTDAEATCTKAGQDLLKHIVKMIVNIRCVSEERLLSPTSGQ